MKLFGKVPKRSAKANLTEGRVAPLLIRMTIPMIFGILSMGMYNIVDTFFVGQLGKEQLAALAFTFPVVLVVQSIALGLGMGTSALVSRALGAGNHAQVKRLATDSLMLGLIVVGICAGIGLATINPLFRLLGATETVLPYIHDYMKIWYWGMIFVIFPMIGNNSVRAIGDTKTPGMLMVVGALVNAALDPLLIFGLGPFPRMGISGAATATLLGRSVTFCIIMYVLLVREHLISFDKPPFSKIVDSWKQILYIGVPNMAAKMIVPLGAGVVTRILAEYGPEIVAGYGVATRIEFFALASVNALSSVMGPYIGQNIGAHLIHRVKEGFQKSEIFSFTIGAAVFVLFLLFANPISRIFNDDPSVYRTTAMYLKIVSLAYGLQGIFIIVSAGLNVLRQPFKAASLSLLQMFGLTIPLGLLGSLLYGPIGVFIGILFSYSITGLTSRWMLLRELRSYASASP
ncbi:MAG: MATE family efflux transporter [Spirochaetia bacterium]|nr:MATE family efflux transporter [Spirochaetia bacterium]